MRSIVALALLCSASALLVSGCANDLESPFKMTKKEIRESVVIELAAGDKLRVNNSSEDPKELDEVLLKIGAKQPGRNVTLIMGEGADPKAVPYVKSAALRAGLGEVKVIDHKELEAQRKKKAETVKEPEPTPVAEPVTPAVPPPAPDSANASITPPPAAPVVSPEPTPASVPATVATPVAVPAGRTYNPDVVTIEVSANNEFKINGQPVSFDEFSPLLKKLGEAHPGRNVEFYREKGSIETTIFFVYKECKEAGLGKLEAK